MPLRSPELGEPALSVLRSSTQRVGRLAQDITRALVEAHGVGISVESAGPGLEATFTVRLPEAAY